MVFAALTGCANTLGSSASNSYFLSAQDGRAGLNDGKPEVRGATDTLAVVELSSGCMRITQQTDIPTSLIGPPSSIAIAPGGEMALVSAATHRDASDPGKVVPFDIVSVVALDKTGKMPPRVAETLHTGVGASGISINREGTLALVANRIEGSVSVLSISGMQVQAVGKLNFGEKSGPSTVAFLPNGRRALVTRDGDSRISLLAVNGSAVTVEKHTLYAGLRPYGLDISPDGAWAVATSLGGGEGDADTISLIDLKAEPPRVVDTVTVGQTPEAAFFAPDGRTLAVTVIDGSNKPAAAPFHGAARFSSFRIDDGRLKFVSTLVGGQWLQGHAFSPDSKQVLVQDAKNRQIRLYRDEDGTLSDTGERLQFDGAPSALRFWR
ncbi:hypothetical protein ADM96_36850 [Burkholderia sp. ST111]|nr:hypothetical protein ADM96_36850 [Burkholderia sp. ST111]